MPFVILVVGSENMFMLTNALVSTPVELPVSTRMAQGLASVGVPVTLTVISDIVLIGFIASATPVAAVREFCIFAIFLLITDWSMQMSFFATVLSIDMQRLEVRRSG
jgi:Sterol-sensing domain of SREBP cleavage-activation